MGNRPAGTTRGYALTMVVFALLTLYMGVRLSDSACSANGPVRRRLPGGAVDPARDALRHAHPGAHQPRVREHRDLARQHVWHLDDRVAALCTWCTARSLADHQLEPWHMFTSIVQYLLLEPRYVRASVGVADSAALSTSSASVRAPQCASSLTSRRVPVSYTHLTLPTILLV